MQQARWKPGPSCTYGKWARQGLILRPLRCQQTAGKRCAERCFLRSPRTVDGEVMRSLGRLVAPRLYPRPWPNDVTCLPALPSAAERRAVVDANATGALWRPFEGLKASSAGAVSGPCGPIRWRRGAGGRLHRLDGGLVAGHMLGGPGRELLRLIREALSCRWGRSRRPPPVHQWEALFYKSPAQGGCGGRDRV